MSDKLHSDKAIREKFESYSVEPPAYLWKAISEQMEARRKKKRMVYIGWISAAAVVVIAFMAGWLLNQPRKTLVPQMVEQQETTGQTQGLVDTNAVFMSEEIVNQQQVAIIAKSDVQKEMGKVSASSFQHNTGVVTTQNPVSEDRVVVKSQAFALITSKNADVSQDETTSLELTGKLKRATISTKLSNSDRMLIAANSKNKDEEPANETGWILGAHISPGYSSHTSSYSPAYQQNMNSNMSGGTKNTGWGMSVQYKTGKKLRIESGVYYAQNTQSPTHSGNIFASFPSFDYLSGNETVNTGDAVFSNTVTLRQDGMVMNSTAGVVTVSQTPAGAELTAKNDAQSGAGMVTLTANGEFTQEFDFVEIPFFLRYRLVDKKLGIDVVGGLNAGIIIGNNAYLSNQNGKQNIGATEDISTLNLSGTVGMGLNYALGRHFSLALEPRFNYYLNSINTNPEVDYKPYRFGLFTGVYYQF